MGAFKLQHKSPQQKSLLVKIKKKPQRENGRKGSCNHLRLNCPLCSKSAEIRRMALSACGHVFCKRCLNAAVQARAGVACPTCGSKIMKRKRCYQNRLESVQ
ncbi:zinc-RING finger domain-containing protein [Phthorimaea operculella]|nr:zinc-RING finger domain-containing protein [Phthorimaea operculella]